MKHLNLLICGYPYSGKGTQGAMVAEQYGLMHLSTGEILRVEGEVKKSPLGLISKSYTDQGMFTPNELVMEIMESVIRENMHSVKGFFFDGFPRFVEQAISFDQLCEKLDIEIDGVINLNVPEDELIRRGIERSKGSTRVDDHPDMIPKRLQVHTERAVPLDAYYRQQGLVYDVDGLGTLEEVQQRIADVIDAITNKTLNVIK
jgi:adenylate kinase